MAGQKKLAIRAGVAAYGADERSAWRMALTRFGAQTLPWGFEGDVPSTHLDIWLVILDTWMPPSHYVAWLRQLTAPTLLVSPLGPPVLQASEVIPHPVLVCSPHVAWASLPEVIEMLLEMTVGNVLLRDEGVPYTLIE